MMLKASALYMVIIIALVIAVLCSSLIVSAYFYRLQYQRTARHDHLQNNVGSGVNILIAGPDTGYARESRFSLFNNGTDSVALQKIAWGVFDIGVAKAFVQADTLYKVFSMASNIDSSKWAALYLPDEDRPLSVSGKTTITGDAYLSKAGVKQAYVDNKAYQGDKRLIIGQQHASARTLPGLTASRLNQLEQGLQPATKMDSGLLKYDSLQNSFLSPTHLFGFGKKVVTLEHIRLSGNIIIYSDTALIIDHSAALTNILVFARSITVKAGFHGTCQLFAADSIRVEQDCVLNYPSCLGVVRFKSAMVGIPEKINIGENVKISGLIFTYDKTSNSALQPLIDLGKNVTISGQLYSQGIVGLKDGVVVNGSVFTSRFLYQSTFTRYENYIINTTINENGLSPYYLSSDLVPVTRKKKKVLQWLETN